jgi:hypothetical protein
MDCVPEPVPAPHQLLLIQYLPRRIDASLADCVFALELGEHARELGSRHPPKRQLVPEPQTVPHLPQFALSVLRVLQAPLQAVWSVGHWQTPLTQVAPVAHALPHVPQLTVLDRTSLHVPPQSAWPVAHLQALCQHV